MNKVLMSKVTIETDLTIEDLIEMGITVEDTMKMVGIEKE